MRTIKFSIGKNYFFNGQYSTGKPIPQSAPAEQVLKALTSHKEVENKTDVLYLSPGHFAEGDKRRKALATGGDIFLFDFDGPEGKGESNKWIAQKLRLLRDRKIGYGAATSFSHSKKADLGHSRCRISIVADRTVSPDEWLKVWLYWADFFEGRVDRAPQHIASIFHAPAYPSGSNRKWSRLHEGECFDVDSCLNHGLNLLSVFGQAPSVTPFLSTIRRTSNPRSLSYRGDLLDSSDPIELADGTTIYADQINPGDKFPCFSPWRPEGNPSAFIAATHTGGVYVHDSGDQTTRFFDTFGALEQEVSHLFSLKEKVEKGVTAKAPFYVSEHFSLLDLKGFWILPIAAPLGRGKTVACQELAAKYKRVLVITDSRALTRAAAKAYGCEYYEDVKPGECPAKLCTTTHSAWKYQPEEPWDLVVIEEAAGVRSAWTSKTCKGVSWTTKEATLNHCANSARIVIQSADLTEEEKVWWVDAVSKRCDTHKVLDLTIHPEQGTRTIQISQESVVTQKLNEKVCQHNPGDPTIFIACTSDQWCQSKVREYQNLYPNLKVGGVSKSNSMNPDMQTLLANPKEIETYDIWIYSPSIKGGVSFDAPCSAVFGRFTGGCTPRDFAQMLLRARNPQDKDIWVSVTNSSGEYQCAPNYLRKLALGISEKTNTLVDSHMITFSKDYQTGEIQPHDPELLDSWVLSERESRQAKNNRLKEFIKTCRRHGWEVKNQLDLEVDEEVLEKNKETYKEAKDQIVAEYIQEVSEAPLLSEEQAEEIEKKITKTHEEQIAQIKHTLDWFYSKDVTPELVEMDKKGVYRRKVRNFVSLTRWQEGDILPVVLDDLRARTKQAVECRHNILKTQLQDKIMRLGLESSIEESEGTVITSEVLSDRLGDWVSKESNRAQVREFIGSSCTAATAEKPVQWFLAQLRSLGASVSSKQIRVDGERQREYTISWEQVKDYGQAEDQRRKDLSLEAQGIAVLKAWQPGEGDWTEVDIEEMLLTLAA